ncbi:MAG: N-acetylmuramic acid 6-phosphate etherase [Rhizobiales bacterium]|nr:N-acetylmuramic acid 6-phosphate etherase [Hyphomicrobiales bacterium]MBI3673038.1 N-acetylmuramic acid 6-phosphate etherase [Hyphomicrobiales bacterium]
MQHATTERVSAASTGIDTWSDAGILAALIEGQERAIAAVRAAIPQISQAAAAIAERLRAGGCLYYAGAGTSIRVGVQDGSELPATFGLAETRIRYLIAGGRAAMFDTLAKAEDDAAEGARAAEGCTPADVVIAIAASGTTPYTVAAAKSARARGACVIAMVNNAGTPLAAAAAHEILLDSGPEAIAGSTRMAAGTAQKAALNLLSTLANIKLGAVHDGLMVNVQADNQKLKQRARTMIGTITGADEARAAAALEQTKGLVKPAVLICAGAASLAAAERLLDATHGNLRQALQRLASPDRF